MGIYSITTQSGNCSKDGANQHSTLFYGIRQHVPEPEIGDLQQEPLHPRPILLRLGHQVELEIRTFLKFTFKLLPLGPGTINRAFVESAHGEDSKKRWK